MIRKRCHWVEVEPVQSNKVLQFTIVFFKHAMLSNNLFTAQELLPDLMAHRRERRKKISI